jgi:hypothetical protein
MAARGKTGLVLAAIGARAACRVGFLRALIELGYADTHARRDELLAFLGGGH